MPGTTKIKAATTRPPARRRAGAPAGYAELKAYFPSPRDRREVLGVVANTLVSWDQGRASRIGKRHADSVTNLLWTIRKLEVILGSRQLAARFLLDGQSLLGGLVPAAIVRLQGRAAAELLVDTVGKLHRVAQEELLRDVLGNAGLWVDFDASLSDAANLRKDTALAAIATQRAAGGKVSTLG